jgi:hypothetical protein
VVLCNALQKLVFQLLLMFDKLMELMRLVQRSTNANDYDFSPAVNALQRELLNHLACASSGIFNARIS